MDHGSLDRIAALYVPLCVTAMAWLSSPPASRDRAAAFVATAWNVAALLALHVAAVRLGWWSYAAGGATLAGLPVDLYLGWALLWGALPALVAHRVRLSVLSVAALAIDLVVMPQLHPVVRLGDWWLVGELVAILLCLVPSQLLARWTRRGDHPRTRASLQVAAFAGLVLGVLTQVILEQTGGSWASLWARPRWLTGVLGQCAGAVALLGVSAVQEFATRGAGTPVPFDPPLRLVTTGPYAYVRNPMQLSIAMVIAGWGAMLGSWWVAAAGGMAVIYGSGFALGDESADLDRRFGARWRAYRSLVRAWLPRWRPVDPSAIEAQAVALEPTLAGDGPPRRVATLYVAEECGPCSEVRAWFAHRSPVALDIVAAERHPTRSLTRITYDPRDGSPDCGGVAAIGRALEHVHFGWAILGMFVRLPGLVQLLQLIADASGGSPRSITRYCDRDLAPSAPPAPSAAAGVDLELGLRSP